MQTNRKSPAQLLSTTPHMELFPWIFRVTHVSKDLTLTEKAF